MRIQLIGVVEPKSEDGKVYRFPYGLPTVIRQLESTDHTFDVVDTHIHKKSKSELMDFLGECDAKVYGISAWSEGYKITKDMAALIRRKNPDATIIVGGILSRSDQALFENTEIDVAVTSADGHLVLPEILDSLEKGQDLSEISGISWRGPGRTRVVNPERPLMTKQQYQDSPIPAYEYFENEIQKKFAFDLHNVENIYYVKSYLDLENSLEIIRSNRLKIKKPITQNQKDILNKYVGNSDGKSGYRLRNLIKEINV